MQAPLRASLMADRASCTVAVGGMVARASPLRMISETLVSSARPSAPPGWNLEKSFSVNPRDSKSTMAKASPMTSMAVEDDVGARFNGQASRVISVSRVASLCSPRVEPFFPVIPIIRTSNRLIKGSRSSSSVVSPE